MAMRIWPWALVLVVAIIAISALSFGRRGDPAWEREPTIAAAVSEPAQPPGPPATTTLRGGLPSEGRMSIDISTLTGEQTAQRRLSAGWRLRDDGSVVLHEPTEEDMIVPGEVIATQAGNGAVTLGETPLPPALQALFAEGVRALLALRAPLQPGERRVGERLVAGGDAFVVVAAGGGRLALSAEASALPGAEVDETVVALVDGKPKRVERQWTRRGGSATVVTRVALDAP